MSALVQEDRAFKKAVIISVSAHLIIFILILVSPYFPKPSRRGMIHYVNVISLGGGGGGSGNQAEQTVETALPQRETLRDLTTPQSLTQEKPPSLTYPVEKPRRERKPKAEKKSTIQKSQPDAAKNASSGSAASGVRIGIGSGTGGGEIGFGSEYSSQIGLSTFPYTYYLQTIHGRISSNWYTSQIKTGITGSLHTTILFKIFRNGNVSEPEIVESSRNRTMDLSAIRAVRSAAPFPPLPNDYEEEYLIVRLIFEHNK